MSTKSLSRDSRRTNWLFAIAVGVIILSLGIYSLYFWEWLRGPQKPAAAKPRTSLSLSTAREAFRDRYLHPDAHVRLAEALFRNGRDVDGFYVMLAAKGLFGEGEFTRAHAHIVLYEETHFLAGQEYDASQAGEDRVKKLLGKNPRDPVLLNYLAHIAAGRGRHRDAVALLDRGLSYHPKDRGLLAFRAELAGTSPSDKDGALPYLTRLADTHPTSYEGRMALKELGRLAQGTRRSDERSLLAREALTELLKKHPRTPEVFSAAAMSAWGRGDMHSVRALVGEAQSRFRSHAGASQIQGALALLEKRPAEAYRSFQAAWEENPRDFYSAEKLAKLHLKHRADPEAALPFYLALYRNDPRFEDGESAELRIRRILDERRERLLRNAGNEGILRYLKSRDGSLRAEACVKAAQTKDPRWIDILAELLDDDTEIVRHNADYALYQIAQEHPDAVTARREDWFGSPKPFIRARALNLFADLERENTFLRLRGALKDPHPLVRFMAKVMVIDHYYKDYPPALKIRSDYLKAEKDPVLMAFYHRLDRAAAVQIPKPIAAPKASPKKSRRRRSRRGRR